MRLTRERESANTSIQTFVLLAGGWCNFGHIMSECSIGEPTNRCYDEQVEMPVAVVHIKELFFNATTVYFGKFDYLADAV